MSSLLSDPVVVRALATIALLALVAGLRFVTFRLIRRRADILHEDQRRKLFYVRSALSAILVVGLLSIWLGQLQNLLLSLTAVTLAIVIATKELLLCISGFVLRAGSGLFSIGDWIEIGDFRGEVTDHSLLSTTILEVESPAHGHGYSGRSLVLPNSLFLLHPVRNENFARNYALHRFTVTVEPGIHVGKALACIQEKAELASRPFLEVASRYNTLIERKLGVDMQGPEPIVSINTTDLGNLQFQVLLFCPTREAQKLENAITAEFLDAVGDDTIPRIAAPPLGQASGNKVDAATGV